MPAITGSTRLDRWTCPLCPWSGWHHGPGSPASDHAHSHATRLPQHMTVADRLALLPILAAEVAATAHAANPSGDARTSRRPGGHRVPREAEVGYLLGWDEAMSGAPLPRLVALSRLCWDAIDTDTRRAHPLPIGDHPTWQSECAWLAAVWPDAQAWFDLSDVEWVDSETRDLVSMLAAAASVIAEPTYVCPDCGWSMQPGIGGWMVCDSGAHRHPGPERLQRQWRRKPHMSAKRLADELGVSRATIDTWRHRGKLKPRSEDERPLMFWPWDVVALRYPDIVAAIDGDTRAAS